MQTLAPELATDPRSFFPRPVEEPARLCLFLASGQADALSGRYFHVDDDVIDMVRRAQEIQENDLHTLRVCT
jgi:hypothetical protein